MTSNKKNGNNFERQLCNKLSDNNIWARLEYPAEDGSQPFDVKAIYRDKIYVFECKDCKNGYFSLDRIEQNQEIALEILSDNLLDCNIMFAFQIDNEWLFVEASDVLYCKKWEEKKKIKKEDMMKMGALNFQELTEWILSKGEW